MHEQSLDLRLAEVQPVFPDIAIFNVPILLHFEVVRNGGKIPAIPPENPANRIGQALIFGNIRGEVDGVGQDAGVWSLPTLIDPEKRMAEHRRRVIHEGRGENKGDGLGLEPSKPRVESVAPQRLQSRLIECELRLQPGIPRHKSALSRLFGTTHQVGREKLSQRRVEFSLRIGLAVGGKKKPGIVLLTRIPAE